MYQHQLRWCLWNANTVPGTSKCTGNASCCHCLCCHHRYWGVPYTWIRLFRHTFLFFPLSIKFRLASRDSILHSHLFKLLLCSLCHFWCPPDIARWGLKLDLKAIIRRAERTTPRTQSSLWVSFQGEGRPVASLTTLLHKVGVERREIPIMSDLVLIFLAMVILIPYSGWSVCDNSL